MTEMQNDGHSLFCNLILINSLLTQNNKMRLTSYTFMGALTTVPITTYCRLFGMPLRQQMGTVFYQTRVSSGIYFFHTVRSFGI